MFRENVGIKPKQIGTVSGQRLLINDRSADLPVAPPLVAKRMRYDPSFFDCR